MNSPLTPFSVDDLYLQRKISALHGVAARQDIAAVVRTVDRENDAYLQRIWICPLNGSAPWPLTAGDGLDSAPRWSPQGDRIAFISRRAGGAQLYYIAADGGEATPCGAATAGVSAHRWLPDGRSLRFGVGRDAADVAFASMFGGVVCGPPSIDHRAVEGPGLQLPVHCAQALSTASVFDTDADCAAFAARAPAYAA